MKNLMKVAVLGIVFLLVSTIVWAQGTAQQAPQEQKAYTIKVAHVNAPDHPAGIALQVLKEEVESKSNNRITVNLYHSASLGSERDIVEACQLGSIDIGIASANVLQSFARIHDIFSLPFLFRDADHLVKVLNGPLKAELEKAMAEIGLKALGYSAASPRQLYASKYIASVNDLKGLSMRVMEVDTIVKAMEALKIQAVPLPFGEVYMGLQMGTIDGAETTIVSWYRSKHYEVAPYLLIVNYMQSSAGFFTGTKFFQSLSDGDKQLIQSAIDKAIERANYEYVNQEVEILKEIPVKHPNVKVIYPTEQQMKDFSNAVSVVYQTLPPALGMDWIKKIQDTK
jgi:tripartite ATP-independent transporter DctP family solute receptor